MTTTITNVAVFDGSTLLDGRRDVSFDEGVITAITPAGTAAPDGTTVDGTGGTLLPGLIDAHVHFSGPGQLTTLTRYGVTTALDMGTWPPAFVATLRGAAGADVRSSGAPLAGVAGSHSHIPGFPSDSLIADFEQARRAVAARIAEGVDHLKLILEPEGRGGLDLETVEVAVSAAHGAGLLVVAHAIDPTSYEMGVEGGVDVLTHVPLGAALPEDLAAAVTRVVPTLAMMRATAEARGIPYDNARASVAALHRAGAVIVAGTDANDAPGVPAAVAHGSSLHDELGLLVDAGLSPVEALRAATSAAADVFHLDDRGRILPGKRADLVLVTGDPTTDITATRAITEVWTAR